MPEPTEYQSRLLKSASTFMSRWRGVRAELRELSASHKTLTILCYRELPPQYNLYIACIGPVEISSPVTWSDSNLCAELRSDGLFIVRDDQNRVRIICEGLEVKENVHV